MKNLEIVQEIRNSNRIIIAGHINPDGDAIGACLSLAMALKKSGKSPIVLLEPYSRLYDFLPGQELVKHQIDEHEPVELFISLDCGDQGRLGKSEEVFRKALNTINIDHHMSNPLFGNLNLVDVKASSTCEIIYEVIHNMGIAIDADIATALYTGMVYDTGGFKHTNTTPVTHQIAGNLLSFGINSSYIMNRLFHTRSYKATKLLAKALQNLTVSSDGKVCFSALSKKEMEELDCHYKDTDGIIHFIAEVENIEVAILIYEKEENDIKVSFRSSGKIDVSYVAGLFGGGGHIKASGCSLQCSLDEAKAKVLKVIKDLI